MDTQASSGNRLSIVIVNWNGLALLKLSLDSVRAAVKNFKGEAEIIMVDNGSMDRSIDVVLDFYPEIKIVPIGYNSGFSKGNNKGVQESKHPWVLLLNNDVKIGPDFLNELFLELHTLKATIDVFSLSPQTNYWEGETLTEKAFSTAISAEFKNGDFIQRWAVMGFKSTLSSGIYPTFYGTGAALLLDKEKYMAMGGFCELYSPAYWEDVDLCFQAWKRGWGSYVTTRVVAWHKISASTGNLPSSFKQQLIFRNFFLFSFLNFVSLGELYRSWKRYRTFVKEMEKENRSQADAIHSFFKSNWIRISTLAIKRRFVTRMSHRHIVEKTSFQAPFWESATLTNSPRYRT